MKTSVVSPGNKGTSTLFYNCGWLTTFVLELGKAAFQLEANRSKDVICFPSMFLNPMSRSSDLERHYRGGLWVCSFP